MRGGREGGLLGVVNKHIEKFIQNSPQCEQHKARQLTSLNTGADSGRSTIRGCSFRQAASVLRRARAVDAKSFDPL